MLNRGRQQTLQELGRLMLSACLLVMCFLSLRAAAAPEADDASSLQTKYKQALQEIERLQHELIQAKGEIDRLKQQLEDRESLSVSNWFATGNAHLQRQQYQEAVEAFTKVITEQPNAVPAYRNRGLVYAKLGEYQQAIEDFDQAIALGLTEAVVYNERGIAAYQLGNLQLARESFDQAVLLDSKLGQAYNNRGIIHRQLGDYVQAIKDLRKASQLGLSSATRDLQTVRDEVQQFQEYLRKAGFDPGPADGIPGSQTLAVLQAYQRGQGLPVTGQFDAATRQALGLHPTPSDASQLPERETAPHFIEQPKPEYPELARQRGWEGTVTLRLELLVDGTVGKVEIAESSGHTILDTAAQKAAQQWRHKPATRHEDSASRWVQLGITFSLDHKPPADP